MLHTHGSMKSTNTQQNCKEGRKHLCLPFTSRGHLSYWLMNKIHLPSTYYLPDIVLSPWYIQHRKQTNILLLHFTQGYFHEHPLWAWNCAQHSEEWLENASWHLSRSEAVCTYVQICKSKWCGYHLSWASQVALVVKNPRANAGDIRGVGSMPGWGRCPGGRAWQPTSVFFPGESHGQRSLVGHSP